MTQASNQPPEGGKQQSGKAMSPSKLFWRQVEPSVENKLEFETGGERLLLVVGCFCLAHALFFAFAFFYDARRLGDLVQYSFSQKDYRSGAIIYTNVVVLAWVAFSSFCMGIWTMFRRTRISLNKSTGKFMKEYRMREFCLFRKCDDLQDVNSVSVRGNTGFWRIVFRQVLCLNRTDHKVIKLTFVVKKCESQAREMAQQIAEFLGVPGPAESELVVPTKAGEADKSAK